MATAAVLQLSDKQGIPTQEVVQIPSQQVHTTDKTFRYRANINVGGLIRSIKAQGQQVPIVVRWVKDFGGYYQIISGFRRMQAIKRLGLRYVRAIVRNDINDRDACKLAVLENTGSQGLTIIDHAIAAHNLKVYGHTILEIAEMLGLSTSRVKELRRISDLPDEVKRKVAEPLTRTSLAHALHLKSAEKLGPIDYAYWIARIEDEDLSVPRLRSEIRKKLLPKENARIPSIFANSSDPAQGVIQLRSSTIELGSLSRADRSQLSKELWSILGHLKALDQSES